MHTWSFFIIRQVRSQRNFLICLCTSAWNIVFEVLRDDIKEGSDLSRGHDLLVPPGTCGEWNIGLYRRSVAWHKGRLRAWDTFLSLASVFIPSRNAPFRDETKPAVSHPRRTRGSQSSREKSRRDESFSCTGARTPGYRLSHGQANANSWLGTKNALYYCVLAGEERSSW